MTMLLAGVLLWSFMHLLPGVAATLRRGIIEKLGLGPYKLVYSLILLASIGLMVAGWRASQPEQLFIASWLPLHAAYALIYLGVFLMAVSSFNSRIKRVIRHPQLTGFAIFSIAHVLVNGDSRSTLLFGGLAAWAVVEMLVINRRDGEWHKPQPPAIAQELKPLLASIAVFFALFFAHPYLSGHALAF
ncbi:MAG: NnrU family protein [Pseudomonadales bacterium]